MFQFVMKALIKFNLVALGIPVFIALFAVFEEGALVFALLSTMITGFMQVCIGIQLLIDKPRNKYVIVYLLLTALFFLLQFIFGADWLWSLPPALAIYLTWILYHLKKENNENA